MHIGPFHLPSPVILAPMAGITDKPFRALCRRLGAGLTVSEMTTADPRHWATRKSRQRMDYAGESGPVSVQLAGHNPVQLAEAARVNVANGAGIIDLNMGCPAKKVCNVASGSALLRDEQLVGRIFEAVVGAVAVPVTVKIRTGYSRSERNAVRIARLAEAAGIAAVAIHGRTREDFFTGDAEFETATAVKAAVRIPVIANGDIDSPEGVRDVLARTGCDAVMIGRGAQGRPWIFREAAHYLATGSGLSPPAAAEFADIVLEHLDSLYSFYGAARGVRLARKHLAWYFREWADRTAFRTRINRIDTADEQRRLTRAYLAAAGPAAGAAA